MSQNQEIAKLPCAHDAAFNSWDDRNKPKCLQGTRVDILYQIQEWSAGNGDEYIFWVNGVAGTGKSTIARTVADTLSSKGQLAASFFFSRGKGDRGDARVFFNTLAVQLTEGSPDLKRYISDAIKKQVSIGYKAPLDQWMDLVLRPLLRLDNRLLMSLVSVVVIVCTFHSTLLLI